MKLLVLLTLIPLAGTTVPDRPTLVNCAQTCTIYTGYGTAVHVRSPQLVTIWVTHP